MITCASEKNGTSDYEFCIVVPIYNEQDNILRLETELSAYLQRASVHTCVLMVDDGSRDDSPARIASVCQRHSDFFYISFAANCGLSAAIKAGIDYCQSRLVGYIDADLQTTPEDFELLLPHAAEHELVTGIRVGRKDTWWKRRQSRIANSFRRMMTGDTAQDTGCPLKVMHTDAAQDIPFFRGLHRFLPAMILLQGGSVEQVPVRHFPRTAGESKFSMRNRFWGPLADCFAYRWMRSRYIRYTVSDSNLQNH